MLKKICSHCLSEKHGKMLFRYYFLEIRGIANNADPDQTEEQSGPEVVKF